MRRETVKGSDHERPCRSPVARRAHRGRERESAQSGAAGRRRPRRLHVGRARPLARRRAHRARRHHRHLGGRRKRRGPGLRVDGRRPRRRQAGAQGFLAARLARRAAVAAAAVAVRPARPQPWARELAGAFRSRHAEPADVALPAQSAQLQSAQASARAGGRLREAAQGLGRQAVPVGIIGTAAIWAIRRCFRSSTNAAAPTW
jgi:hypothetical protein